MLIRGPLTRDLILRDHPETCNDGTLVHVCDWH
jgi:hypothetical protein